MVGKKLTTALLSILILLLVIDPALGQGGTGKETPGTPSSKKKTPPPNTSAKKPGRTSRPTTKSSVAPLNSPARVDQAPARAARAKDYLVNTRGIDSGRLTTVDGGHFAEMRTELWVVPKGAEPPMATPMASPVAARPGVSQTYLRTQPALYFPLAQNAGLKARKFDEYGDIKFDDEKARLDNFAVGLQNEYGSQGYIITYSKRR